MKTLHQSEHESWNANNYPGTRQLCSICDEPTGRCEEDSMYLDDDSGPVCEQCYLEHTDEVCCEESAIATDAYCHDCRFWIDHNYCPNCGTKLK